MDFTDSLSIQHQILDQSRNAYHIRDGIDMEGDFLDAMGGIKIFKSIDEAKAAMKAMTPAQRAAQRARDEQTISERATRDYMDRVGASQEMRDDTKSVMGTIGGIKGPLSVDMVTGVVTDPLTGDVIGGRDADKARKAAGFGSDPTAPDVAGGGIGAGSAPGRGAGTQTPSGAGAAGEFGGEPGEEEVQEQWVVV